jgi:uncharacterized protein (TIGR03083 family)
MATLSTYVPVVHNEANGLAQFLDTLSTDDWQCSSACDLWTIQDVTAHLVWAADFYSDTVSRGRQGDISLPENRPPGNAPDPASLPTYFDQQAMRTRDRLGPTLLSTFRSSYQALSNLMLDLSPQEWDMQCSFFQHYGGQQPAQTFLFLIIQELVIHGWDIRSRFQETATLAAESLPALMERIPNRFFRMPGLAQFPIDADRWPRVRYRFDLQADQLPSYDMVVEGGKARMEPSGNALADVSLCCDPATFLLMMYKRLSLDCIDSLNPVTVEGEPSLVAVLNQWLKQP